MKITRYQRVKRPPLPSFESKLAKTTILATRHFKNISSGPLTLDVTAWIVPAPTKKNPSAVRFIKQIILRARLDEPHLLTTPYGRVCPHCQTNEYLRSILDFHTIQVRDQNQRKIKSLDQYCAKCNRHSVDGSPLVKPRTKSSVKKPTPVGDYTQSN
jgi:hypothetical protein